MAALWLAVAGPAVAQPAEVLLPPGPAVSEPCRKSLPLADIDSQLSQRQRALAVAQTRNAALTQTRSGMSDPVLRAEAERHRLRVADAKGDILDLIFARACHDRRLRNDPLLARFPDMKPPTHVEIMVHFGTNRRMTGSPDPEAAFGTDREPALQLGTAVVSLPTDREPGDLPRASLWKLDLSPDPTRHVLVRSARKLAPADARRAFATSLDATANRAVLVFVHGYNTGFAEAAMRTAQIAVDLGFAGVPMFFTWPSADQARAYARDEEMVILSEPAFAAFLDEIAALGPREVFVVAHSMGTRLVSSVLRERQARGITRPDIAELLLAAPDINVEIFRERIAPALSAIPRMRRTIYTSRGDLALVASRVIHDFVRVGETDPSLTRFDGFETIDASAVALQVRAFGHSYVVDSTRVLADVRAIVADRKPPEARSLTKAGVAPDVFWVMD
jgi:esterase/lipase superfamily enzyme